MSSAHRLVTETSVLQIDMLEEIISSIKEALVVEVRRSVAKTAAFFACEYIDSRVMNVHTKIPSTRLHTLSALHGGLFESLINQTELTERLDIRIIAGDVFLSTNAINVLRALKEIPTWKPVSFPTRKNLPTWLIPVEISWSIEEIVPSFDGIMANIPTKRERAHLYTNRCAFADLLEKQIEEDRIASCLPFVTAQMLVLKPINEIGLDVEYLGEVE